MPGVTTQNLTLTAPITNTGDLVLAAAGDLTLAAAATLAAPTIALSAGDTFTNQGASLTAAQWVVYADEPTADVVGGASSGQPALWNGDIVRDPRHTISGNRYVFRWAPDVVVTALPQFKVFDTAFQAGTAHPLEASVVGPPHPGVSGLFAADSLPTFIGGPSLTSTGRPHDMPERPASAGGPYPIVVSMGDLSSPLRYDFVLRDGHLTVDDQTPPTVTPHLTGTAGENGWHRSDATLSWSLVDIGTHPSAVSGDAGCATRTIPADVDTTVTCVGTSLGGTTEITQPVRLDASAPTMSISGLLPDEAEYTAGSWTNQDVEVFYTCGFDISGPAPVDAQPVNRSDPDPATTTGDYGGTCRDAAGNSTTQAFQVNIDKAPPAISNEQLRTADADPYTPGTWANQIVSLTWDCADEPGGSGLTGGSTVASAATVATLQGGCEDNAGNVTSGQIHDDVLVDLVDPTITDLTLTSGGSPYTPGTWARGAVTLTWGCDDQEAGSGPAGPGGDRTATSSGDLVATCADGAGNTAEQTVAVTIDDTPPSIGGLALTTADGQPYTSGDWTNLAVTLRWTCTDAAGASGATEATGSLTATSSGPLRATCTDVAGNSDQSELFQAAIDTVAPVLSGVPDDRSVTTSGDSVVVSWTGPTATDDLDSSVDVACDPSSGSSFPVGTTEVTCTATDHADNTASATFAVTVTADQPARTTARLRAPVDAPPVMNVAVHGRAVPVRVSLTNPVTTRYSPLYVAAPQPVACTLASRSDVVEWYTAHSRVRTNLFTWDRTKRNWLHRFDTRALTRNACYRVPVMYGGRVQRLMASGGTEIGAFFIRTR
jgi:hypothetical protein